MEQPAASILVDVLSALATNCFETLPCFIGLLRARYGNGKWGGYALGIAFRMIAFLGALRRTQRHNTATDWQYFFLETVVGILLLILLYFKTKSLIKRRIQEENRKPPDGQH